MSKKKSKRASRPKAATGDKKGKASKGKARATSAVQDGAAIKSGASITEHTLRNGLRVLLAERHHDPIVAVMIWYAVGSHNEREEEAGVSHFLEHMMFKGSDNFAKGEVDHATTCLGGSNNAFTTPDHTAYWFELASDRWEKALEIEADRMQTLTLDPVEFEAEKKVVLEELSMGEDDPWRNLSRQALEVLFPRHSYRRPVIGYADVLQRMTPDNMRDFYDRFYHPGNAVMVISGDIDSKKAMRAVRKHFAGIPTGPARVDADPPRPAIAEPKGERRIMTTWDDSASRLLNVWPTATVGSDDDFVLDVVSTLLTTGRLARLHRRLVVEQGLATNISTNNEARVEAGVFWLFAHCVQGVSAERLQAAIDHELKLMASEKVSASELKRAKSVLSAGEAYEGETVSDVAEDLGGFAIDADWRLVLTNDARRRKVTAVQVRDVVGRLLTNERRVVAWSLPEDGEAPDVLAGGAASKRKRSARKGGQA